jgi:hypothetical protein
MESEEKRLKGMNRLVFLPCHVYIDILSNLDSPPAILRGGHVTEQSLEDCFEVVESSAQGHVAAILGVLTGQSSNSSSTGVSFT